MLISEKKLRFLIKKIISEGLDPDSFRDPSPFPGEDLDTTKTKKFFGYDITNTTNTTIKRKKILDYVSQFKQEFLKAANGITLTSDEQDRLNEFGRNCIGFLIGLHEDSKKGKNSKYPSNKSAEFLQSTRNFFNDLINKDLKISKTTFFDIIINDEIKNELLNLDFENIPVTIRNYLQKDPDFISLDSSETLGIDKRSPTVSDRLSLTKKRIDPASVPDNKINFKDIQYFYYDGEVENTRISLQKRISHILTLGPGIFSPRRSKFYGNLMDMLDVKTHDEVNKWLLSIGFNSNLLNQFIERKAKPYGSYDA